MKLLLFLSACAVFVHASSDPLYGESFQTTYKSRGDTLVFPSTLINEQPPYFAEDLNFDAIEGKLLIGAADKLYVLDKNLMVVSILGTAAAPVHNRMMIYESFLPGMFPAMRSCIGSCDPYCVWDSRRRRCMASTLSAVGEQIGSVPVYQLQNIHTGMVQYAPKLTPINSSTTYVYTGLELRLQCGYVAIGDPVPTIQWFHNNSLLMDGSGGVSITRGGNDHSSAVIASVDPTSGGIYMCKTTNSFGSSEVNYTVHVLEAVPLDPPQVLALCSVVVWYTPAVTSAVDIMITGYDVRFYSPQSDTENVIRHVGANQTFYIVQNEDKTVANLEDIYVQIRVVHDHRTTGEWSDGIILVIGCDKPTTPPDPEAPSVYFELSGMMCMNNSAASLLVVGEGADSLLCNARPDASGSMQNI